MEPPVVSIRTKTQQSEALLPKGTYFSNKTNRMNANTVSPMVLKPILKRQTVSQGGHNGRSKLKRRIINGEPQDLTTDSSVYMRNRMKVNVKPHLRQGPSQRCISIDEMNRTLRATSTNQLL